VYQDAFQDIVFSDYQVRKEWAVLLFYPFDYTFVCPTELISYSNAKSKVSEYVVCCDVWCGVVWYTTKSSEHALTLTPSFACSPLEKKHYYNQFDELNTKVLAISTDSHHAHLAWTRAKREDGGVGALQIPLVADTAHDIARSYGVLVTDPEDEMYGAALRGLFIVDASGKIRMMQINDDSVGRNVEETLRLVKAFQYSDAHVGEACPASWQPGDDAIKADPWGAREYFSKHGKD